MSARRWWSAPPPYLTALIGIELDTVGEWAQRRRIPYSTYRDLSEKPEVLALVQEVVDDTNRRLARSETVKRFRLIPKELDHEDGELTATQKVKRAAITGAFGDLIEGMYRRGSGGLPGLVEEFLSADRPGPEPRRSSLYTLLGLGFVIVTAAPGW